MKVATTNTIENFRYNFVHRTFPFFGVLYDAETATRIEVDRDSEGNEVIDFRSQGQRLALYIKKADEQSVVRIFGPEQGVDLFLFWEVIAGFYKEVPEIPEYFREGLEPGAEEVIQELEEQSDKVVFSIIMNLETFVSVEDLEAQE